MSFYIIVKSAIYSLSHFEICFCIVFSFILRFERLSDRKKAKQGEIFHLLVFSLNDYKSQGWATPEPGARDSNLISHMAGSGSVLEPSSADCPRTLAVDWLRIRVAGTQPNAAVQDDIFSKLLQTIFSSF